jgi:uncharacterized membrane protein HdeD (DUF308 family)
MSTADPNTRQNDRQQTEDLSEIIPKKDLLSGVGALTILLGLALIVAPFLLPGSIPLIVGCLVLATGVAQLFAAYVTRRWFGSVAAVINGFLYLTIAVVLFSEYAGDVSGLILTVALLVFTAGISRIGVAMIKTFKHREVALFNGALAIVFAGMLAAAWYGGMTWAVGALLGLEVIMTGVAWIAFSVALRREAEAGA